MQQVAGANAFGSLNANGQAPGTSILNNQQQMLVKQEEATALSGCADKSAAATRTEPTPLD